MHHSDSSEDGPLVGPPRARRKTRFSRFWPVKENEVEVEDDVEDEDEDEVEVEVKEDESVLDDGKSPLPAMKISHTTYKHKILTHYFSSQQFRRTE